MLKIFSFSFIRSRQCKTVSPQSSWGILLPVVVAKYLQNGPGNSPSLMMIGALLDSYSLEITQNHFETITFKISEIAK